MTLPEPTVPAFALYTWESQVCQYDKVGPPGIRLETYVPDGTTVHCLLHRNRKGRLTGILNHYPDGSRFGDLPGGVNMWVDPARQGRGIGTALVAEAQRRWGPIDVEAQKLTEAGHAFAQRLMKQGVIH